MDVEVQVLAIYACFWICNGTDLCCPGDFGPHGLWEASGDRVEVKVDAIGP